MTTVKTTKPAEGKRSYDIIVHTNNALNTEFTIPVVDARDGENEREKASIIVRNSAQPSKYMRPSFGSGGGSYQAKRVNY